MTQLTKSEQTRQSILDSGLKLATQGGFAAMGLSALLKECCVPKGSFYHYFPSKEAFGQEMVQQYVAHYLDRVDALMARDLTGAETLRAFCDAWTDADRPSGMVSTCLVVNLGAEVAALSDDMRRGLDLGVQDLTDRLAEMIRRGVADGSLVPVADPETTASLLYAQLLGAAILSKLSQSSAPLQAVLTDFETRLFADT